VCWGVVRSPLHQSDGPQQNHRFEDGGEQRLNGHDKH
jgi:hypothetical protein